MPTNTAAYLAAAGATIWDPTATTQLGVLGAPGPPRVRWDRLRPTAMGYTTWRGMSSSGVGIGMQPRRIRRAVHIWAEPIHAGLSGRWAAVCCAAAIGTTTPTTRGAPFATASTRPTPSTTLGFVV